VAPWTLCDLGLCLIYEVLIEALLHVAASLSQATSPVSLKLPARLVVSTVMYELAAVAKAADAGFFLIPAYALLVVEAHGCAKILGCTYWLRGGCGDVSPGALIDGHKLFASNWAVVVRIVERRRCVFRGGYLKGLYKDRGTVILHAGQIR
jgi:hypothetical protein